ncbi:restriction endonuclease subunit S [Streptomyces sp. NPDC001792]|uniref:restriction endonuclease subunit S n=1 Tax=Streptomyces sp. NPDC001792 TaxID=3154524 RepID=UPI00332486DE
MTTDSGARPKPGGSGSGGGVTEGLPAGWARATLGELGEWFGGGTPSKRNPEFWTDGTIPWLSPKDMGEAVLAGTQDLIHESALAASPVKLLPAGAVAIVVRSGILERKVPVAYVPFEVTLNQDMKAVVPYEGIDGRWLAVVISSQEQRILADCRKAGTTVASLEVSRLMEVQILVPPLAEQHRIVAKLENQLAHIEVGARSIEYALQRAEQLPTAIVDSLVEGLKAEGLPVKPLSSLLGEPLRNGVSAKATRSASGIRTLTLTAVTRGKFIDQYTKMTEADPVKAEKLWLRDGDIFVQRSNSAELVGTSAIYRGSDRWAIYPDLLIRVRVDSRRMAASYVALVLRTSEVRHKFRQSARGLSGSMPKIDQSVIEGVPVPVPSLERQREIVEQVQAHEAALAPLVDSVRATEKEGESLRAALLHAAFTGALVHQDPADEPASVLLDRIRAQRAGGAKPAKRKRAPRTMTPAAPQTSGRPVPSGTQEALPL